MTEQAKKIGYNRYSILALVFMATTINYFDRSIVGVMAPT
jgi:ACS family hexuronate transporter-like MFS transporter